MNISGILVVVNPEHVDAMVGRLGQLDGVDVYYIDAPNGRIVITQEAETINDEVAGLQRIRALPGIILAEMSYHNFEDDTELLEGIPDEFDGEELDTVNVPGFLNE